MARHGPRTPKAWQTRADRYKCDEVSYETGDADADEVAAEMRRQDRNRRRRLARRRAKVEATQRARRRIQRARDYLSIIGEVGSGTVYRDDAVDGYYVASAPELEELGALLEADTPDAYSHWCAGWGREATPEEVEAASV